MSGRKRSKGAKSRYFGAPSNSSGKRNTSEYCSDRRLLPRIKQYVEDCRDNVVDIDDMAITLQAEYPEYARKKRLPFRALVAKMYSSIALCIGDQLLNTKQQPEPDEWLEKREKEHIMKKMNGGFNIEHPSSESSSGFSDSEAEMNTVENFNMMNNSVLQLYGSSTTVIPQAASSNQPEARSSPIHQEQVPSEQFGTFLAKPINELIVLSTPTVTDKAANREDGETSKDNENMKNVPSSVTKDSLRNDLVVENSKDNGSNELSVGRKRNRTSQEDLIGDKPRRKQARTRGEKLDKVDSVIQRELEGKHKQEFKVQTSSTKFSDLGGCEGVLEEVCRLLLHLRHPELFSYLGVRPLQGFLLHGPPGCGKTLLAHAIAGELELPFIKLAATEVVSGVSGESEATIRDLFSVAKEHAPCVLFFDEVDAICPKRDTTHREMEKRVVTQLLASLDDLNQSEAGSQVLVIGATSRTDTLDPALRRSGRFDREVCLGIPSLSERESILRLHCSTLRLEEGFNFSLVSQACPGFVGADLVALVREASLLAINRVLFSSQPIFGHQDGPFSSGNTSEMVNIIKNGSPFLESMLEGMAITQDDFIEAIKTVQPSAKREGFATVPDTTWEDVGALEGVREELTMAILAPVRYPAQFSQLGLSSPPGVLLAGPPGCGKTLLAKAIANETGINFISVKGPELLNMYVGESERAVRQVFQRARNSSPCVIFFDELDALCPKRSEMAESNASARVVNQLLTEMDGLESRKQVFVMGATNRPDIIDPAVLRPGRLDKVLYVGLPSAKDRAAILRTITKNGTRPRLDRDVDLIQLARNDFCKGFSGADLSALVREAAITALKEHMNLEISSLPGTSPPLQPNLAVSMRHFRGALAKFRPSVSAKDSLFYKQMAARFTAFENLPENSMVLLTYSLYGLAPTSLGPLVNSF